MHQSWCIDFFFEQACRQTDGNSYVSCLDGGGGGYPTVEAVLPEQLHRITRELRIVRKDGQQLCHRLGNQQTVEGFGVVRRKMFQLKEVLVTDGQQLQAVSVHLVADVPDGRANDIQFAELDLDGDLPEGDKTEEQLMLVRLEDPFGLGREPRVIEQHPDEGVGEHGSGKKMYVGVVRETGKLPYLRTRADGKWNDNLLAQIECTSNCTLA
jgi:hypothetical protein